MHQLPPAFRPVLWGLGLLLLVVGSYLLYFETGLNRWVPIAALTVGLVILAALVIMAFSVSAQQRRS